MLTETCAGIDIGGTKTDIGLVDKTGAILFTQRLSTLDYPAPETFVKDVARIFSEAKEKTGATIVGIGVGAPDANYFSGNIEHAPNMPWKGIVPLGKLLSEETGLRCTLTNDANAAALGELLFGKAIGLRDFVVVTLGTGLGTGFIVNGELLYGHDGFAGELGHVIIEQEGRQCGCGRKGCLETYVSATGIVRTAVEWLQAPGEPTMLSEIPAAELSSEDIFVAATRGDRFALRLFDFTAQKLGFALANMVAVTSPSHIFLYGGLAKSGELLLAPTRRYFEEFLLRNYKGKVKIALSGLPDNAAVLGAAALGWKAAER